MLILINIGATVKRKGFVWFLNWMYSDTFMPEKRGRKILIQERNIHHHGGRCSMALGRYGIECWQLTRWRLPNEWRGSVWPEVGVNFAQHALQKHSSTLKSLLRCFAMEKRTGECSLTINQASSGSFK